MNFPDEHILAIFKEPWYVDIFNYLVTRQLPAEWIKQNKYRFFTQVQYFFWEEPYFFKYYPNQIIQRCIPEEKQRSVLNFYHEFACGGYFGPHKNLRESLTKWVLLAHFIQRLFPCLQVMCKLSKNWKDFEARHDALKPDSRSRNFLCLGYRFYGTIFKFIWQLVHLGCNGLHLQMGRSCA